MEITKEYLEQKIQEYKQTAELMKNNANACIGAIQALENLIKEIDKTIQALSGGENEKWRNLTNHWRKWGYCRQYISYPTPLNKT